MARSTNRPGPEPDRSDAIPESYAVHVNDQRIAVWQYCVDLAAPDGRWDFVEVLDREDNPRLTLGHATPRPPSPEGYWIYGRTYDCELDCE